MSVSPLTASRAALALAAGLGLCFDQWLRGPRLGAAATLYLLLMAGALVLVVALGSLPLQRQNAWLGVFVVWLAAVPALRDAPLVVALDVAAVIIVLLLAPDSIVGAPLAALAPGAYLRALARVTRSALTRAAAPIRDLATDALRRLPVWRRAAPLLRGLLLAAPILLVFTALLASADVVFGAYVERLVRLELPLNLADLLDHASVSLVVAWLIAGWLLHGLAQRPATAEVKRHAAVATQIGAPNARANITAPAAATQGVPPAGPRQASAGGVVVGFTETTTVLAAIDLLFGGFVMVQFTYLFGGGETLAVTGLTYAEYARRGFFELLAVAAIALPLVVGLESLTPRSTLGQRRGFQALAGAMVACTVVILGSAMVRMGLYEDAYGYTHLRVYSHAFMLWLAAVCGLFLMALLAERRQWLTFGTFVAALLGLGGMSVLNPDRFIAEQNLARYVNGRPLDASHLTDLSADATPVVLRALDEASARGDTIVHDALGSGLWRQLQVMDAATAAPWPAWNFARAQAHVALASRRDELESFPLPVRR
jgi:hypothetical protein